MPVGRHQCEHTSVESDLWTLDSSWSPVCTFLQSLQEMIWRNPTVFPSSKIEGYNLLLQSDVVKSAWFLDVPPPPKYHPL